MSIRTNGVLMCLIVSVTTLPANQRGERLGAA